MKEKKNHRMKFIKKHILKVGVKPMDIMFLCIKIFFVRMTDVSLGTIRTIVTVKGKRVLASFIGFVEVFVWFTVAQEALSSTNQGILIGIFYAGGFAAGTFLGSFLSARFIKGNLGVQVITSQRNEEMIDELRRNNYAVSVMEVAGHDKTDEKYMLFIEIETSQFNHLRSLIKKLDKNAFVVVNETKYVQNGYFEAK